MDAAYLKALVEELDACVETLIDFDGESGSEKDWRNRRAAYDTAYVKLVTAIDAMSAVEPAGPGRSE